MESDSFGKELRFLYEGYKVPLRRNMEVKYEKSGVIGVYAYWWVGLCRRKGRSS